MHGATIKVLRYYTCPFLHNLAYLYECILNHGYSFKFSELLAVSVQPPFVGRTEMLCSFGAEILVH